MKEREKNKLPNLFVAGAAKAGTTSVYRYLSEHPEVYMGTVKEPYYFSFVDEKPKFQGPFDAPVNQEIITDFQEYKQIFSGATNQKVIGESSNSYLYFKHSAENIRNTIPDCKIIILLRNPIDRAFSHYLQCRMLGQESLSFEEALDKEKEREKLNWRWHFQFTGQGMYYEQVKKYYQLFDAEDIFIGLFDDLKKDSITFMNKIFNFLGIEEIAEEIDFTVHNRSGLPKNDLVHKFLRSPGILKSLTRPFTSSKLRGKIYHFMHNMNYRFEEKPQMNPETRERLTALFKDDILRLQELIGRDLNAWIYNTEQALVEES